ncbi:MAG: protein-disulfide reductase DsbD family protein [Rubrivivax sp.]
MIPALRRPFLHALERGAATLWLAALSLTCAWSASAAGLPGPGRVVQTEQVRAELIAHAPEGIAAGRPMWLGLRIDHAPGWHTYWKNPGDSGLPTELNWQLPAGYSTGEIVWPTPRPLPLGSLMNFGYEGTLVLPVPLTVPEGPLGDTLPVRLQAQWLVCKDVCIPEEGTFAIDLPTRQATGADAALFDAAFAAAPAEAASVRASAQVQADAITVTLTGLPEAWVGRQLHFMPETPGVIDNAATPTARWEASTWQARVALSPQRSAAPQALPVVLTPDDAPAGVRVALTIEGVWPPVPGPGTSGTAPGVGAAVPPPTAPVSLWAALLLALAGGLLLNLMPCVFPVLALKVVGFATHGTDRRGLIAGGLAYTAGVIASFIALAGLLLALRAGGEQLGWGFQLQSPAFVAALAALFTLIGLNLVGVFEFGQILPGRLAAMRARHPTADSALTGVLAVAVASPCTAPFMGASLGLAVSLPALQALSVFAALGLGMALPYLIASVWPAFARALPRPGAWMAWFKGLMAFPMFATVIWLLWVLGQQSGIDAVAGWLGVLLALGMACWVWAGSASARASTRRFARAGAIATLALTLLWAAPGLRTLPPASAESADAASGDARWQVWSSQRAAQALAQGRPVFVDYTAAWCVTCQYNKRTTLSDPQVLEAFARKRVLLLRADWTRRDPEITAALTSLGRNGVPVYALTAPGDRASRLLGEILSVREVLEAVDALP